MAFIDIIFFAAIAIFVGYRLWGLLGTHEIDRPTQKRQSADDDLVLPIRPRVRQDSHASQVKKTKSEKVESPDHFLKGAAVAFRKIVGAYAKGEIEVLRKLLEGPLLDTFEEAIEKRHQEKKVLEIEIERLAKAEVLDQWEEKTHAYITVRFVSQQCLVTRNKKGKVLLGDPDQYSEVTDIWTFSRPLKSSDPNWKLVATQLPEG